jgi:hypothetical protein
MPPHVPRISCREILTADLDGVLNLLVRGFPERSREHLKRTLDRLSEHATAPGFPKFGYMLESDGAPVGVVLVIFSSMTVDGVTRVRGNVANWYVDPAFRSHATLLTSHALAHKTVTFLNISPARHTWPILEAQGYKPFCSGLFIAYPSLASDFFGARVKSVSRDIRPGDDLSPSEIELLLAHKSYGCISVTCTAEGRRHPFVFARRWQRWKSIWLPYALLVYCRGVEDFVRFSGPLGRFLTVRGMPMVFIDSNGVVPGLSGRYVEWGPKFYKGKFPPRLGDLSYTERVMFGL